MTGKLESTLWRDHNGTQLESAEEAEFAVWRASWAQRGRVCLRDREKAKKEAKKNEKSH